MLDPVFAILLTLGGAVLFATAALPKLRAPAEFAAALLEYRILPGAFVRPLAVVLPLIESTVAIALLWSGTRSLAASLAAVLLVVYATAIGVNLARGRRDLNCGCGGSLKVIGGWMVARNAILAAALLALCFPVTDRALGFADILTVGAGFVASVLLYASADLLLSRPAPRPLATVERS